MTSIGFGAARWTRRGTKVKTRSIIAQAEKTVQIAGPEDLGREVPGSGLEFHLSRGGTRGNRSCRHKRRLKFTRSRARPLRWSTGMATANSPPVGSVLSA